jgi:hypothetical protein
VASFFGESVLLSSSKVVAPATQATYVVVPDSTLSTWKPKTDSLPTSRADTSSGRALKRVAGMQT